VTGHGNGGVSLIILLLVFLLLLIIDLQKKSFDTIMALTIHVCVCERKRDRETIYCKCLTFFDFFIWRWLPFETVRLKSSKFRVMIETSCFVVEVLFKPTIEYTLSASALGCRSTKTKTAIFDSLPNGFKHRLLLRSHSGPFLNRTRDPAKFRSI